MTNNNKRCPYRYWSLTQMTNFDNQCIREEGHQGQHIQRELFPPPQPSTPRVGWYKD